MPEHDGSMTDRFMGVFRSVAREPIGDARYAQVRAHRRRSMTLGLIGLVLVAGPAVSTALAVAVESEALISFSFLAWIIGPVLGAGMLHTGWKRLRHLRGIHADSEVEIFAGSTPMFPAPGVRGGPVDAATLRLFNESVVRAGRTHRLVVHPETGLLLEVDGALVKDFVGGDVSITARVTSVPAVDPAAKERPLSVLERHELRLHTRRLTRGTWGPLLGAPSAAAAVICLVWATTSNGGADPDLVVTVLTISGALLLVAAVDGWHRRRLRATLQRDAEAGLQRTDDRWLLPESGICWEENGLPGPLRLAKGGLGSEADGRTRPVMF